jgi:predicted transcriptional regulator
MEVRFTVELQAKLTRLAAEQGRNTEALVQEAVERFVNVDEWFMREVEQGLEAAVMTQRPPAALRWQSTKV